jgi:hypothetical protein
VAQLNADRERVQEVDIDALEAEIDEERAVVEDYLEVF